MKRRKKGMRKLKEVNEKIRGRGRRGKCQRIKTEKRRKV